MNSEDDYSLYPLFSVCGAQTANSRRTNQTLGSRTGLPRQRIVNSIRVRQLGVGKFHWGEVGLSETSETSESVGYVTDRHVKGKMENSWLAKYALLKFETVRGERTGLQAWDPLIRHHLP